MAIGQMDKNDVEPEVLSRLEALIHQRIAEGGDQSYVAQLVENGEQQILKKFGEEAIEVILAAKSGDKQAICHECADLLFHMLVLLPQYDIRLDQVLKVLKSRIGVSGLREKALRSTLKSG